MEQKVSTLFLVQINYSSGYVFNLKHEICFDLSLQIRSRAKQIVLNSQNEYWNKNEGVYFCTASGKYVNIFNETWNP